ncbi:MAG: hypothetical protein CVV41_12775 [Candidatus Riflebacteria bacterium HGW-Riflebacteria-1]|nr:MAG: hypothetical protein CVV41_12775 [Candidatus Riflebacteria bacterium HGW-Riflebacteria-1]
MPQLNFLEQRLFFLDQSSIIIYFSLHAQSFLLFLFYLRISGVNLEIQLLKGNKRLALNHVLPQ